MAPGQVTHLIDRAVQIARATRTRDLRDRARRPAGGGDEAPPRAHGADLLRRAGAEAARAARTTSDLARAAEVLNAGERVAILVGAGARGAAAELEQVAELLGAGVAKALNGRDVLPDDLPYVTGSIGLLGHQAERRDDAGLRHAADDRLGLPVLASGCPSPGQARGVQIDIDARMLGIRYPMEVNLAGDARDTLRALLPLLRPQGGPRVAGASSMDEIERWWRRARATAPSWRRPAEPAEGLPRAAARGCPTAAS